MKQYLEHSLEILSGKRSEYKQNRTGIDAISLFGYQNHYDLREGFPLMTTKKMPFKTIAHELIWFMRGESNIKYLVDNNIHIWDGNGFQHYLKKHGKDKDFIIYSPEWQKAKEEYIQRIKEDFDFAEKEGDLGPVYGKQWRHWKTSDGKEIDQFKNLVDTLRKSPSSRRLIVSAWNPEEIPNMALPPCHVMYHLNVNNGFMDLQLYQRSCDMFLGVPFNVASYSMLAQVLAQQANLKPRMFVHTFGDSHFYCGAGKRGRYYGEHFDWFKTKVERNIYAEDYSDLAKDIEKDFPAEEPGKEGQDHVTAILEQLSRTPIQLPTLEIANKDYDKLAIDDFKLKNYDPYPVIKREMAV
jgi:thymidylate synthase